MERTDGACHFASRRVASLYYRADEFFWERLCRTSGIGNTKSDQLVDSDYQEIAFECAEHALECKHPGCGVFRLAYNGES